nr:hypothetical protein [Alteromonas sp. ASW11-130]
MGTLGGENCLGSEGGPITLQRYIAGTNIRTYVCGENCLSAELKSDHADFRSDNEAVATVHHLPMSVSQLATKLCDQMGMRWGAIDWRLDNEGKYWFLEINPAPYFLRVEHDTGLNISGMLVTELTQSTHSKNHSRLSA